MQNKIKNTIEKRLSSYLRHLDRSYSLSKISPLLFKNIEDFVLGKGKRLRPVLFVAGYLGFAKKPAPNLYQSALSIELLHDFMLVHDDIIDKAKTRRGKPSLHNKFNHYLKRFKNIKFNGQDLSIVSGDVMYAMAIDTFLSIKEKMQRKEKALRKLIETAVFTGMGEFIELLSGTKDIARVNKQDIYKIYDCKTAYYTFACPLCCGAILAGADKNQIDKLHRCGIYLGRAFQIKDDILGMFATEKKIGKTALTDLQESKKTLLVWYAYKTLPKKDKLIIRKILSKVNINKGDLLTMRSLITTSGALDCAQQEVATFLKKAKATINSSNIRPEYKTFLNNYTHQLLHL